jgi:hypothetical protein
MFRRRKKNSAPTLPAHDPSVDAPAADGSVPTPDRPAVRDLASVTLIHQIARGDLRLGPLPTGPTAGAVVREEVLCAMAAGIVIAETWAPELRAATTATVAALTADGTTDPARLVTARPDSDTARRLAGLYQHLLDELRAAAARPAEADPSGGHG